MKNSVYTPQYIPTIEGISISHLPNSNIHNSTIAGFNWKNTPFPYFHKHDHWEILLVIKGKISHKINDHLHTATKGYACLLRPDDTHCFSFLDPKSETLTFCFSNDIAKKILNLYPLSNKESSQTNPLSFSLQANTLDAILSKTLISQLYSKEKYEQYSILIINRLILAYNEQKLNTTEAYPEWLNAFLLLIKNPKYLRLPITKLAAYTPYSYSHFSMLFRQYTGKTIVSYLNELKLLRAKELLRNTNYTIGEIAVDLNYESTSSLNHNFKRFTGLTPTEFRKSSVDF